MELGRGINAKASKSSQRRLVRELEDGRVREGVAEDERGHPGTGARELGKLLRQEATQGGPEQVYLEVEDCTT